MKKDNKTIKILFIVLPIVAAFISLCMGRYFITPSDTFKILVSKIISVSRTWPEMDNSIILNMRLPRIIITVIAGAGLAAAGAAMQGIFSNPLASPDILGVSSGASFGAAITLLITSNMVFVQLTAMLFGIIAFLLVYLISSVKKSNEVLMVVLSGIIVSSFFEALVSLVKYVADPETKLPAITFWLMGSFDNIGYRGIIMSIPGIIAGIIIIAALRWRINSLSLSDDEADTLGIKPRYIRIILIVASTMITSSIVAACGKVAWVGLVIPHIARMIVGNDNKRVVPACISIGACYLLVIDDLARCVTASEIPISILTALVGVPVFALLLRKTGGVF